jgi:hypothetical protein
MYNNNNNNKMQEDLIISESGEKVYELEFELKEVKEELNDVKE